MFCKKFNLKDPCRKKRLLSSDLYKLKYNEKASHNLMTAVRQTY